LPKPKCERQSNYERKMVCLWGKRREKNATGLLDSKWFNLIKRKHT
jgi:hypothetical protein